MKGLLNHSTYKLCDIYSFLGLEHLISFLLFSFIVEMISMLIRCSYIYLSAIQVNTNNMNQLLPRVFSHANSCLICD